MNPVEALKWRPFAEGTLDKAIMVPLRQRIINNTLKQSMRLLIITNLNNLM